MSYLIDRKTELIFRTASLVTESGKARSVVIESRPKYAVVKLSGTQAKYPISWEHIFHFAKARHVENLRLEQNAAQELENKGKGRKEKASLRKARRTTRDSRQRRRIAEGQSNYLRLGMGRVSYSHSSCCRYRR